MLFQVEVAAADCAILRATPSFICSGDTSGNVCIIITRAAENND